MMWLAAVGLATGLAAAGASLDAPLDCRVEGSDDRFLLHPHQLLKATPSFQVFILMDGLTLAVVNRDTGRFNRLSNLNLLPDPQPPQFFHGYCQPAP